MTLPDSTTVIHDAIGGMNSKEAFRLQEEQLWLVIDALPPLISFIDSEQRYQFTNKRYEEWFGLSREQMRGKHMREILGQEAYENVLPRVEQALRGTKVSFTCWVDYKGAGKRYVEVNYLPQLDERGETRGFLAFILDSTERKRDEEELQESKERFQRLVETTNVIGWEADLETWAFTYVSPQVTRLLGYQPSEWYEGDFWIEHLHPEDREYAVKLCAESSKSLTEYEFEYRMIAADGRTVWLRDLVSVVDLANGKKELRGYLIDVTDRKKVEESLRHSEEQLQNLLENIPDHLFTIDSLGIIRYINHTAPGFRKDEVLGKHFSTFLEPESRDLACRCLQNVLQSGTPSDFEGTDVNSRSYRIRYVPVNRSGEVGSVLMVATDVTEQKRSEKSRRNLIERLESAREVERRTLARELHDEASQDLSAAGLYLTQVSKKIALLLPEEESIKDVLKKADELIQLTHESLRRTAHALHPSILEHYGLVIALQGFTQELSKSTDRSGLIFEMETAPDLPRLDRMVETAAYRITQEAITNAFKHAQARHISINLGLHENMVSIVVEDDGRGIDHGAVEESRGIGLAAMYERADLIGAKLDISTKVSGGTRLALDIPFARNQAI